MRFSLVSTLVVALAANATASTWFGKPAYNKWHETELERWLSDHNVPYPAPSDRKDLENLVKDNWDSNVVTPYNSWDISQLTSWMNTKGYQAKKGTEKNKDSLIQQVKGYWTETADQASGSYDNVQNWILDSWTESQLKAFCDKHGVPVPQPRSRDSYLKVARDNYQTIANKVGETAAYPGDWLYESWSTSDLKSWCDERGIPVPQPTNRDKLIASVRRNSRISSNNFASYTSAAAASASSATNYLSDALLDSWSDSQIKEWADKNGIKVPQGSKRNELVALARKHRASLVGNQATQSVASAYSAATSSAGNQYASATDDAALKASSATAGAAYYFNWITNQIGLGASTASASATSLTGAAKTSASKSASSASSAYSSLSSAASSASVSASKKASKSGSKEAKKAGDAAAESMSKGKHRVQEAYQSATNYAKQEL
ncbi:hypothetical protein EJ08DRAFT_649043 [Tothia fuscella]|uniref:Uncharacterized protein n=1 Tax=Tothia fuscella TaxID=1048955 RepID=A0A9P4NU31_9PEZI|nr:hypothetical protein EJ08DRAFT_649043 [Tothia fuscella]